MDPLSSATAVQLLAVSTTSAIAVVVPGAANDHYATAVPRAWIGSIAVAALVSGVCSYFLVASGLVDVMSLFVVLLGPIVAVQKVKLAELGSFRQVHNALRQNVNALHQENQTLMGSIDAFTKQSVQLDRVQKDLHRVAQSSGASVNQLVTVVQENGTVQKEILQLLQAQVLQQVMSAVLAVDADRDFVVDPPEVESLMLRLQNLPGMEFDAAAFRTLLTRTHPPDTLTLADVCALAKQLREQTQTIVQSTVGRRGVFAPSSSTKNNQKERSPRSGTMEEKNVFCYKPRTLLKSKKILGFF